MFNHKFLQEGSNLFTENRLLKFSLVCVVLYSGFLTVLFSKSADTERTHLIPVGCIGSCWIQNNAASDDYLRLMAEYIVYNVGNVTAGNARRQLSSLLYYFVPQKFDEYRERFNSIADIIERYPSISYSIQFNPKVHIQLINDDTIRVSTTKRRIVRDEIPRTELLDYELKYSIDMGRFWIKEIKELKREEGADDV